MIIRAKSPLRLGLAGGGTDVSPYSDDYGGAILNATISMYAYATVEPRSDGKVVFDSIDRNESKEIPAAGSLTMDGAMDIYTGIYNRVIRDFVRHPVSFRLSTYVEAPAGSGLGTSSTLVVTILGALAEWLRLPLGEYDLAHLAYEIERKDLDMAGGKQDQYAAAFGGFNFMEFYADDKVIVNPLRIRLDVMNELEHNLLLYYTGTSRLSHKIIEAQRSHVLERDRTSVEAMHRLKEQAVRMKEAILKGQINEIGEILDFGWKHKKQMASEISNPVIDEIYDTAKRAGATGGKISGAGGGGFMMFYCPDNNRYRVMDALRTFGGEFRRYHFTKHGMTTWKVS